MEREKQLEIDLSLRSGAADKAPPVGIPVAVSSSSQAPEPQFFQGPVIYTPVPEELGLHLLSDGIPGEKPPYPYPTIVRCAILGSPRQRLTLSEIYLAMENRYPWFKTAGQGWKVNCFQTTYRSHGL